jgi:hypothetical protein
MATVVFEHFKGQTDQKNGKNKMILQITKFLLDADKMGQI